MNIKTVTVIGANGTMGRNISAIFASFGNAKVYMVSRDIEKSKIAAVKASKSVRAGSTFRNFIPADYSILDKCIRESELVFESVTECFETKVSILKMVTESMRHNQVVCTGTSGISVSELVTALPEKYRAFFMGMHFFNPPYSLSLCEIIPTEYTNGVVLKEIKQYLTDVLFRTVVEIKDYPAFLGNRIGFQFINEAMQYADVYRYKGGINYIDSILGSFTGRNIAPLVTADYVGLDVHKAIVENVYNNTLDYAHKTFLVPDFLQKLINKKLLGRKTESGLYKFINIDGIKKKYVYDIQSDTYKEADKLIFPFALKMKAYFREGSYKSAFKVLVDDDSTEARLCVEFLLKYIVYSLFISDIVGNSIHSADDVMATGFNWCPPLAMIEAFSSVTDCRSLIKERLNKPIIDAVDIDNLFFDIEKSKYDYRIYFKSLN